MDINVSSGGVLTILILVVFFFLEKYVFPITIAKKQFIHKLQFEKEFKIYSELWQELLDLKNFTQRFLLSNGQIDDTSKEGLLKISTDYDKVEGLVSNNKPFYHRDVYENATKILHRSMRDLFGLGPHNFYEIMKDKKSSVHEKISEMDKAIDDIEEAIRKRIGSMGKSKLIE